MGNTCCAPEFRLDGSVTGVVFRVGLYQDDPSMEPPEQVKIPNPEPTTDDQQTPKASKPSELVTIPEEPEPPTPEETATAPPPPSPETIKPDRHMKRVSSTVPRDGCVLPQTEKITNFEDLYTCGKELGRGEFGTTFECVEKATGKRYACKTIEKSKISTDVDAEEVRREIEIMHRLRRLPNVVSIEEAYEDDRAVHIVMELCEGGDLSKAISRCQNYREREVAKLAMKIVRAVKACHSLKVMHRDIKPDNFLFVNSEDGPLKIIDFGLSTFFKPAGILVVLQYIFICIYIFKMSWTINTVVLKIILSKQAI